MALTRITKGVIKPNENYDTHNINSTGIVTAIGLDVNGNGDISGSLNVGGVLTYEDVTSIDSVGIITARTGLVSPYADIDDFVSVGNNIHLGNAGVITATSFVGSGAALTGIDATAIKDSGGNVKIQAQASGAVYTGIHTFNSDLDVDGHTNLDNLSVVGVSTFTGNIIVDNGTVRCNDGFSSDVDLIFNADANNNGTGSIIFKESGSEKLRIGASGQIGIAGANYGSSGQVLTSGGASGSVSWSTVTGTTINNNADNRIITGSGTANTLNGEANLTFDGTNISVGTGATISSVGNVTAGIATFAGGVTFKGDNGTLHWRMKPSGVFEPAFNNFFSIGDTYYNVNNVFTKNLVLSEDIIHNLDTNTKIRFPAVDTISMETAGTERLRIDSGGSVRIANTNFSAAGNADELILGTTSGNRGLTIVSGNTGIGALFFADDGQTNIGSLVYEHNTNQMRMNVNGGQVMRLDYTSVPTWIYGSDTNTYTSLPASDTIAFTTGGTERLRFTSSGSVGINTTSPSRKLVVVDNLGGGIGVVGGNAGIYMGEHHTGGFINNCAIARAAANNYHITGSAVGDLCIAGEESQNILFGTSAHAGAMAERLRIKSSGQVLIGTTDEGLATYGEELTLGSSDHAGMTIRSGTSHKGTVYFSDATSGTAEYIGSLQYDHSDNSMRFRINGTDTLFINSSNNLKVPDSSELQFGGSLNSGDGDLRLYHNGSNSYVHGKTGLLQMKNEGGNIDLMAWNSLLLRVNAGEVAIDCNHNGSVDLYHNNEIRAHTVSDGFYIDRVNTFSNPNNTGSETQGAMIDLGGNIHFKEIHPVGAYTDRCDLVLNTNSGYGLGLSDKLRITAGGRIVVYSSVQPTYNKGWAPGNLVLHNNNNDLTVDFTQGILFTDNANNDAAGGWMHGGIVCTGSTGYNGNMCFGIDGNGASNNNISGITERMRITHQGTVRIMCDDMANDPGSSNRGVMIGNTHTASVFSNGSATGFSNNLIFMNGNGVVGKIETNGSSTNYNQSSSDRTLKKNFENWTEEVLPIFKNLNPQKFNFLPEDDSVEKTKGFIAQDLTEHFPRAYPLDPLTGKYNYNPGGMVVYLMKALQEEIVKREALEARISALEGS